MENSYQNKIIAVGIITIISNTLLTLLKIIVGLIISSAALVSDGLHSASDILTTVVVIIGAKIAQKAPDKEHPFGHERMESIASIFLALLLAGTAFIVAASATSNLIKIINDEVIIENDFLYLGIISSITSILTKYLMYVYTIDVAKKIHSTSLKADAYHHLSDSLSSIGSLIGIIGLMIGEKFAILDPIASFIIALFILKVAYEVLKQSIDEVVDKSGDEELEKNIREIISNIKEVIAINSLKTRMFASRFYVEIEIAVDGNITVSEGHNIAKLVHDRIEESNRLIKHCMVHVDPYIDN